MILKGQSPQSLIFHIKSKFSLGTNYFHLGLKSLRRLTLSRELKQIAYVQQLQSENKKKIYFKSQRQCTFLEKKMLSLFYLKSNRNKFLKLSTHHRQNVVWSQTLETIVYLNRCLEEYEDIEMCVSLHELILQSILQWFLFLMNTCH